MLPCVSESARPTSRMDKAAVLLVLTTLTWEQAAAFGLTVATTAPLRANTPVTRSSHPAWAKGVSPVIQRRGCGRRRPRTVDSSAVMNVNLAEADLAEFGPVRIPKYSVIFMRHGEAEWNIGSSCRFMGWADLPLTEHGEQEAKAAAETLLKYGFGDIDEIFCSYLKRSIKSSWLVADAVGKPYMDVTCDWRLNEQMYGSLQGQRKKDVARRFGLQQTQLWRRSYDIAPPPVEGSVGYFPSEPKYAHLTDDDIPESWCGSSQTESLKDTQARAWRMWKEKIVPAIRSGKKVMVLGHGNLIRAMLKRLDRIPNETLQEVGIPRAMPLVYDLDEHMEPIPSAYSFGVMSGRFLAGPRAIHEALKAESNAAQLGLKQQPPKQQELLAMMG